VASNLVARQKCIPTRRNRHTANPAAPNQLLTPSRVALSRRLTRNPAVPNQRLTPNPAALNQHPTPNRDALNQHPTPSRDTLNQLLTRSRAVQNDRLRAHRTRRPRQLQSPMNGLRPPLRNIQPLGLKRIQRRIQLPSRSQRPQEAGAGETTLVCSRNWKRKNPLPVLPIITLQRRTIGVVMTSERAAGFNIDATTGRYNACSICQGCGRFIPVCTPLKNTAFGL